MSKSDAFENALLLLIFNGTTFANMADNAAASPATILYVSWHTADPTDGGTQSSSEATYTGVTRTATNRNAGTWTVTGNSVSPVSTIDGGLCTLGTDTITHFGVGLLASGAGRLLYSGPVAPNIAVSAGVTPQLTNATAITED